MEYEKTICPVCGIQVITKNMPDACPNCHYWRVNTATLKHEMCFITGKIIETDAATKRLSGCPLVQQKR